MPAAGSHRQEGGVGRRRGTSGCPCAPPPPPQAPGTKTPQRQKKKQRQLCRNSTTTTVRAGKQNHKSRKQQARSPPLLEIPSPGRNPNSAQNNEEENQKDAELNKVSASASTVLDSSQADRSLSAQLNESLRRDRILEDPVAEEERLRVYKMNRRKPYEIVHPATFAH